MKNLNLLRRFPLLAFTLCVSLLVCTLLLSSCSKDPESTIDTEKTTSVVFDKKFTEPFYSDEGLFVCTRDEKPVTSGPGQEPLIIYEYDIYVNGKKIKDTSLNSGEDVDLYYKNRTRKEGTETISYCEFKAGDKLQIVQHKFVVRAKQTLQ